MKGKYITTQILLACLSKPQAVEKDIHTQLKETIAEHRKIVQESERLFSSDNDQDFVIPQKKAA